MTIDWTWKKKVKIFMVSEWYGQIYTAEGRAENGDIVIDGAFYAVGEYEVIE